MNLAKNVNINNKEIGSEFCDVPVLEGTVSMFPEKTVWYLSGRCALRAIIRDIKQRIDFKKVALPSWCCDSLITPFLEANIEVVFYSVYPCEGVLKQDFSNISKCEVLLVMDFFGYKRNLDYKFDGIVINDVTHSIFSGELRTADYTFGSLRKWAGFYTGGFAFSKKYPLQNYSKASDLKFIELRKTAMNEKKEYISGNSDSKEYLSKFSHAEGMLEEYSCGKADKEDILKANSLDVEFIRKKRRDNASIILKEFSTIAIFSEIKNDDCPLFVPLLIPNGKRDSLKKYLIEKRIYCPVHWPVSEFHKLNPKTKSIYEQEISIICDQRYSISDMEYICYCIKNFLR